MNGLVGLDMAPESGGSTDREGTDYLQLTARMKPGIVHTAEELQPPSARPSDTRRMSECPIWSPATLHATNRTKLEPEGVPLLEPEGHSNKGKAQIYRCVFIIIRDLS